MKKIIILLFAILPFAALAQNKGDISKYLKGAVTMTNGQVTFDKTYEVPGKDKIEIFNLLKAYTKNDIIEGADHLQQCGFTESDSINGLLAASVEEYLYFKRTAFVSHRVRFFYQLIYKIEDGKFNVQMRRMQYLYDDIKTDEVYYAENWITDFNALKKNGTQLTRIGGKFRRFTIDRKDEIFHGAANAVGAKKKMKMVEVEE